MTTPSFPSTAVKLAIATFVQVPTSTRMIELASSNSRKAQRKLVTMLAHFDAFRSDRTLRLPSSQNYRLELKRLARRFGASELCEVLSENRAINGTHMTIDELFEGVDGQGFGTLAVIDGTRLGFFQGEERYSSLILIREDLA